MIKKFLTFLLCGTMFFCLVACGKNDTVNTDDTSSNTHQSETTDNTSSTESVNVKETTSSSEEAGKLIEQTKSVFETENITRITFYAYYGSGKGSEVPSKYMTEITNWLNSFTIGENAPDLLSPGTNTYYVEIEYSDGTVTKNGLDVITVDGIAYYLKSDKQPDCFMEIMSKTSLE